MRKSLTIIILFILWLPLEAHNRALLVGIGDYDRAATGWSTIHGNNDVALLDGKLAAKGFTVSKLVDTQATKAKIIKALDDIVSVTGPGDMIYIHFSGHGQLIEDLNGDEPSRTDQSFVCYDACRSPSYLVGKRSYRGENHLVDDELFPILNRLKKKVGDKGLLIVVFDSCYSGGADRGEMSDDTDTDAEVEWVDDTRGTDKEYRLDDASRKYMGRLKRPGNYGDGGDITIISACQSYKRNYECRARGTGKQYGSLSYCIARMLDDGIPFAGWADYFRNERFRSLRIFRPIQTPVVETY